MANQPIRVRLGTENKQKIISSVVGKSNFSDLNDVKIDALTDNNDNYVVVYSSALGKFTIVNPDTVLSAASTSTGPQPGLPSDFIDVLDKDLDSRIDVDGGSFDGGGF
jgi:hypothetical protein